MAAAGVARVVVMPWTANRDAPAALEQFAALARDTVEIEEAPAHV